MVIAGEQAKYRQETQRGYPKRLEVTDGGGGRERRIHSESDFPMTA